MSSDESDLECPLCMEEIDITDKYFKPCPCGYQICRFCWNHINNNLNGLCPACRRPFSEETLEFKPVAPEELARIKNDKKKKERERKEQELNARKHLSNVRVVQKNLVYVLGLPPNVCSEDILRQSEYFGQYGKILKIVINRRTPNHPSNPTGAGASGGVYITYSKKEDAAKAIEAVDGSLCDGRAIRATFGTTKYCSYYLRNQPCQNTLCQYLHEPGEEADTFYKEELSQNAPTKPIKQTAIKSPPFPIQNIAKKDDKEESALPATASWARTVRSGNNNDMDVSVTGLGISEQYQSTRELRPFNVEVLRLVPGFPEKPLVSLSNLGFTLQLSYYGPFDPFKMEGNADSKEDRFANRFERNGAVPETLDPGASKSSGSLHESKSREGIERPMEHRMPGAQIQAQFFNQPTNGQHMFSNGRNPLTGEDVNQLLYNRSNEGLANQDSFPLKDPAIMAMRMSNIGPDRNFRQRPADVFSQPDPTFANRTAAPPPTTAEFLYRDNDNQPWLGPTELTSRSGNNVYQTETDIFRSKGPADRNAREILIHQLIDPSRQQRLTNAPPLRNVTPYNDPNRRL